MNAPAVAAIASLIISVGGVPHSPPADTRPSPARVSINDNRQPAGTLRDGTLELKLDIVTGRWFPESDSGPSIVMQAFAEQGKSPQIPGPLVRVTEGTVIRVTLHNSLDLEAAVHGLHSRPAKTDDVVRVPAGATREATFEAGAAGTYFYWASTTSSRLIDRMEYDSQLSGAIIVDPKQGSIRPDRVFVIGLFHDDPDSVAGRAPRPREFVVINGKEWPHTEQFTFNQGDTARWRVIDATAAPHPMHLHGFYFNLERVGTEAADTLLSPSQISRVNTHALLVGSTMSMWFVPDRPGNWLFHCHLALHVDGSSTLSNVLTRRSLDEMQSARLHSLHSMHSMHEMAGLIIGIHVLPKPGAKSVAANLAPQTRRLFVQTAPHGYNRKPAIGFVLQTDAEPRVDSVTLPGPTLLLEARRPARITVINRLKVPTSVHWHGMEIESYPDGVAGWSGMPGKIAPMIQPSDSFLAEFTPPRAGTFIYHSHMNELLQTNSGMYGALIVTDSAHPYDPSVDKIILVGGGGPGSIESRSVGMVNGTLTPQLDLEAGKTYRLRIIQIHPQALVIFRLGTDTNLARWTPVAKDGADLPPEQSTPQPAFVLMGAGETGDFLFTPDRPGVMRLTMNTRAAGWYVPMIVVVRPSRTSATTASASPKPD